ncbi:MULTISPECIES: hypothetical protein [Sphingobacterium]|uniref:hypothetical protein n=1 Tax=Sphingobacterium TaxID=28453 RepID=UPI00257D7763|nr:MULTISPECIES: hypothetical protein [Sphingobacterium]
MKKYLVLLSLVACFLCSNGQDLTKIGESINGTLVTIKDKSPIGYTDSLDGVIFRLTKLSDVSVTVSIANKSDEMLHFSYNDSYFIVDGTTESIISETTLMIDKDKSIQDIKIAPNTSTRLELFNKTRLESYGTIWYMFSNKKANNIFKRGKGSEKVSMVLVLKNEKGEKIKKEFIFTVRGSVELKELRKSMK